MKKTIHYIGLDVHKNSIAMAIAVEHGGELRSYGTIGGKLADLDKLIKKLEHPGVELRERILKSCKDDMIIAYKGKGESASRRPGLIAHIIISPLPFGRGERGWASLSPA